MAGVQEVIDWTHELTPLVDRVADELGLKVIVKKILRLSGGAINQNFLIELTDSAGTVQRWVLRRSQSVSIPGSLSRAAEYAIPQFGRRSRIDPDLDQEAGMDGNYQDDSADDVTLEDPEVEEEDD